MAKVDDIITVVTPGVPVALGNKNQDLISLDVQAHEDNSGKVYVAFSNVNQATGLGATLSAQDGFSLGAEELRGLELADFFVDAENAGDKVVVLAIIKDEA